jgi:hypothetical protein
MKLLLVSVGSALAYSCNNKLPSLAKACGRDYKEHCSQVDKSNLVSVLACGKNNQADLQPACVAEIQKDFSALYACTEDLSTSCPDFGRVSREQWGNDNDDDDDSGSHHRRSSPPPPSSSVPMPPPSAMPPSKPEPVAPGATAPITPALPEGVEKSDINEGYTDYFTWDFYISEEPQDATTSVPPSSGVNALHSQGQTQDGHQCFIKSYPAFSAPCLNAIAQQWATIETAKGVKDISAPSAEEAYSMMTPPVPTTSQWKKVNRTLFYIALAFFVCTLVTCLCCCCRRCKKRRAARVVPSETPQEVALSPLPEAVVVPMAGPARYTPLATPVPSAHAVRAQTPTYIAYTGQGLSAYVPIAQPVQV